MRAPIHWWLRHRKPFRSCAVHCGCDCDGLRCPCNHADFRILHGRCAHCGRLKDSCREAGATVETTDGTQLNQDDSVPSVGAAHSPRRGGDVPAEGAA